MKYKLVLSYYVASIEPTLVTDEAARVSRIGETRQILGGQRDLTMENEAQLFAVLGALQFAISPKGAIVKA